LLNFLNFNARALSRVLRCENATIESGELSLWIGNERRICIFYDSQNVKKN